MSFGFGFSFVGPREKVLGAIDKSIADSAKYNNDTSQQQRARDFIAAEMERYPAGKVLYVKAGGHHSVSYPAVVGEAVPVNATYSGNLQISISEFGEAIYVA